MANIFHVLRSEGGVQVLSEPEPVFERIYLEARNREGWLYEDEEVRRLPYPKAGDRHADIWRFRAQSLERLINYVRGLEQQPLQVLEVGCGNGWFSHAIAMRVRTASLLSIDINMHELKQAARVFGHANPVWFYGDIFTATLPSSAFHLILFNGTLQYFPDLPTLFARLLPALAPNGEVHIVDSPLYMDAGEQRDAEQRTAAYYRQLGSEGMTAYFHAHRSDELIPYHPTTLYHPRSLPNRLKKVLGVSVNPLPWVRLRP